MPASIFNGDYVKLLKDKLKFKLGGIIEWDHVNGCPSYPSDIAGVNNQIGQELHVRVYNPTGAVIPNGSLVYVEGVDPDGTHAAVMLAIANDYTKSRVLGMVTADIPPLDHGIVTREGLVNGLDTSAFSTGDVLFLSPTVAGGYQTATITDGNFEVRVGHVVKDDATTGSILVMHAAAHYTSETTQKTGWSNEFGPATIAFDNGTRTLTISPVGSDFHFYQLGIKYAKTTDSVQIPDVEGRYFFYYNLGTLTYLQNWTSAQIESVIKNNPTVAVMYWDATNKVAVYYGPEFHDMQFPPLVHMYNHKALGARYISGLTPNTIVADGSGASNAAAQFGIDAGEFVDEDISFPTPSIASTTGYPIFYLGGTAAAPTLRSTTNAGYPITTAGTGRMAYNFLTGGNWTVAEVPNGNFALCHVFALNENTSTKRIISIMGQAQYATVALARAGATTEIVGLSLIGIVPKEMKSIATFIFETNNTYSNAVKSRIRSYSTTENFIDWRSVSTTGGTVAGPGTVSTFADNNLQIFDNADSTKVAMFECSGITTATTRTYTLPDASDTLVGKATADLMTNKSLVDTSCKVVDAGDNTKIIDFNAGGTTGTKTTITGAQTANRVITLPDATTTMLGHNALQTITNKQFDDALYVAQNAGPSYPASGFNKIYPKADNIWYTINSSGVELPLGYGSGEFNFLQYKIITNYITYDDSGDVGYVAGYPVNGTGGTVNYVSVTSPPSPIDTTAGVLNLRISKSASNAQGEGISVPFDTRGDVDKSAIRTCRIQVKTSANYTDDSMGVYLFDVTNSRLIYPADQNIKASSFVSSQQFEFQLSPDSTSYRLILHVQSTNALAYDLDAVIKFVEGKKVTGPYISDWIDYTPVETSGTMTNEVITGKYMLIGEHCWIQGRVTFTGAVGTWANPAFTLPAGIVPEGLSSTLGCFWDGAATLNDTGTASYMANVWLNGGASNFTIYANRTDGNSSPNFTQASPFTYTSADRIDWMFGPFQVAGRSSNQVLSEDAGTRLISFSALKNGNQTINNATSKVTSWTVEHDTTASWDASNHRYIIPETGYYDIFAKLYVAGAASSTLVYGRIYKNGSQNYFFLSPRASGIASQIDINATSVPLNKGDYLEIYAEDPNTSSTLASSTSNNHDTYLTITKRSSPQQIAASERSYGSYSGTDGATVNSGTESQFKPLTKLADSYNAYSPTTGQLIINKSGSLSLVLRQIISIAGTPWSGSELYNLQVRNGATKIAACLTSPNSVQNDNRTAEITIINKPVVKGDIITFWAYQSSGVNGVMRATADGYSTLEWEIN